MSSMSSNSHDTAGRTAVVMEVQVMTDVLVVGAGPTGLMLANQLGRRGVRVTIIDRHSGPARESRAMAVHARTLEIYSKLGLVERALELGTPGYGANMWAGGRLKARIPLKDMGKDMSPFPYVLMLGQDDNERIMGEHLRRWGLSVQWNTELVALDQQADHVTATVKDLDGRTRTITAAYVAGCDGSRSAVRTLCGIEFPGAPYEHAFFVADTEATGPMVANELNVFLWRSGFHLYFPMKGTNRWRVIGILPNELARQRRRDLRGSRSGASPGRRDWSVVHGLSLVLDLPHPPSLHRTLPRPPLLPARRRRAHP